MHRHIPQVWSDELEGIDSDRTYQSALDYFSKHGFHDADVQSLVSERMKIWASPDHEVISRRSIFHETGLPSLHTPLVAPLPIKLGNNPISGWTYKVFLDYASGEHHAALIYGDIEKIDFSKEGHVPVRIQSSSKLGEIFFGMDDTKQTFDLSMQRIIDQECGVIIYLEQDGRGGGVLEYLNILNNQYEFRDGKIDFKQGKALSVDEAFAINETPDKRNYTVAKEILDQLGIEKVNLYSRSKKKLSELRKLGIDANLYCPKTGEKVESNTDLRVVPSNTDVKKTSHEDKILRERLKNIAKSMMFDVISEHTAPWMTVAENRAKLIKGNIDIVEHLGHAPAKTLYGDWTLVIFGDLTTGEMHRALVYGDWENGSLGEGENILTRIHSSCKTNEIYNSTNCECKEELRIAMSQIQKEGRGVIIYLDQEGRGTGMFGKMEQLKNMFSFDDDGVSVVANTNEQGEEIQTAEAYEMSGYPPEARDFTAGVSMLKFLGINSVKMFTNNPRKTSALRKEISVKQLEIIVDPEALADPDLIRKELTNKRDRLGHQIDPEKIAKRAESNT